MEYELYNQIAELYEQATVEISKKNYNKALELLDHSLQLVPEPKEDFAETKWIYATMGNAQFLDNQFESAINVFKQARLFDEGVSSAFVLLRLGQCYLNIGDIDNAKEFLLKAYMMEGEDVFEDEEKRYFDVIQDLI